jgi:hypothetical protein
VGSSFFPLLGELDLPENRPSGVRDDSQPDAERSRVEGTLVRSGLRLFGILEKKRTFIAALDCISYALSISSRLRLDITQY